MGRVTALPLLFWVHFIIQSKCPGEGGEKAFRRLAICTAGLQLLTLSVLVTRK